MDEKWKVIIFIVVLIELIIVISGSVMIHINMPLYDMKRSQSIKRLLF